MADENAYPVIDRDDDGGWVGEPPMGYTGGAEMTDAAIDDAIRRVEAGDAPPLPEPEPDGPWALPPEDAAGG